MTAAAPGPSIERRLLGSTVVLLVLLGGILVLVIRQNAIDAAEEAFDRVLGAAALAIADTVAYENGALTVDLPYSAFAILGTSRMNRVFYRVADPDRVLVTGLPTLGLELPHPTGPGLRLYDSTLHGERVRIAAVGRYRSDALTGDAGWIDVLVAETREAREVLARQLTVNSLLPALLVALLAFGLVRFSIRRALAPLRQLEEALRSRGEADLSPYAGAVPREISALVITLNAFMKRLDSTLEGLKRVTADAAHQLRTPLAALRAQAEVALEDDDPARLSRRLRRIHANAVSASTLSRRLLQEATLLHKLKAGDNEILDLRHVVTEAMRRMHAAGQGLGFRITLPGQPVAVLGETVSLVEMVRNILENASLHGLPPVVVTLTRGDETALLEVRDHGPGIPTHLQEAVFDRFVRDSDRVTGSGLGLAIARDVAIAHGGSIGLIAPSTGGLCVHVRLPRVLS